MHRASSTVAIVLLIALPTTVLGDGNGVPVCTAPGDQLLPVAVSDMAGGLVVAWHDGRPTVASGGVCFAQRLGPSGVAQWTADGVQLSTTGDPGSSSSGGPSPARVAIASDGAGGAFVAYGGFSAPCHVQRVNAAGVPQWGADGVALTFMTGDRDLAITRDLGGSGGAIVAWRLDNGTGGLSDIYMQKVDSTGALLWTALGQAVTSTSATSEERPALFSDGAGGVFVAWNGGRLKIQRFDSNGQSLWSQIPVGMTVNNEAAVMASDGSGGVIVAWAGGGANAQRVSAAGARSYLTPE